MKLYLVAEIILIFSVQKYHHEADSFLLRRAGNTAHTWPTPAHSKPAPVRQGQVLLHLSTLSHVQQLRLSDHTDQKTGKQPQGKQLLSRLRLTINV